MSIRRHPTGIDEHSHYTALCEIGGENVSGYINKIEIGDLRYQLQSGMYRVELPMLTEFLLDTMNPEQSIPARNRWWGDKQLLIVMTVEGYSIKRAASEMDRPQAEVERLAGEVCDTLLANMRKKRATLPPMGKENTGELDMKLVFNKIIEHLE